MRGIVKHCANAARLTHDGLDPTWLRPKPLKRGDSTAKVGVLGTGQVGDTLANGFIKHGYQVMRGSRSPDKLADWKAQIGAKGDVLLHRSRRVADGSVAAEGARSCSASSAGTRRTWGVWRRRGRSSRCACSGASAASESNSGCTPSSC